MPYKTRIAYFLLPNAQNLLSFKDSFDFFELFAYYPIIIVIPPIFSDGRTKVSNALFFALWHLHNLS